ncbi:helix-turn-helix domain-containing protein [Prosthecobacter fluviatilis]|uniref:Helix-turn-helix domain-containing protein n=1 Tax=Prosthecobacter fluviatilis TaxID=445931 RepID=A0ABW0KXR1_9BACT
MKTNTKKKTKTNIAAAATAHAAQAPGTPPELLTQVQMAQRLGISRRTLHSWVREGTVPMVKVRGYCRFDSAKVYAALLQHEVWAANPGTRNA